MSNLKTFDDFSKEERTALAEMVNAWETDTLIKSEAVNALEVLKTHNIVDTADYALILTNVELGCGTELIIDAMFTYIDEDSGVKIMKEYFGYAEN